MLIRRSNKCTEGIRVITTHLSTLLNPREHATFACGINDYVSRTQWLNS